MSVSTTELTKFNRYVRELALRKIDALRLYEPLEEQKAFHDSLAPDRVARGSNQAGKTLVAAVELARVVTGQHPTAPKRNGIAFIVGKDGKHLAQVQYKKLFREGPFDIIRDLDTGYWRAFHPWDEMDWARKKESQPAPPLIHPRYIANIAWESKRENLPNMIRLINGWELYFFSSLGKPPQGSIVDWAWMDEEIVDPDWYPELSARLIKRRGRLVWSATPQAGTDQLFALHESAAFYREQGTTNPPVEEFILLISDNKFIHKDDRAKFAEKLSDDERLVRVGGEFALLTSRVFPEYQANKHVIEVDYFDIPPHWTRYVSVDPGRQICAVLFLAVPPPEDGDFVYLYDELYIPNCSAAIFGESMRHKCGNQEFEAFIIDHHEGRKVEAGYGRSIEDQYSDALRKNGVECRQTGCRFAWGNDDPKAGIEEIRNWLRMNGHHTKLRLFADKVPNLIWEFKHYRYKKVNKIVTDEPEARGRVHQMANLRYQAMFSPRWVAPEKIKARESGALLAFRAKQARMKKDDSNFVNLGPRA